MRRKSEATRSRMIDQKEKNRKGNITSLQTGKYIYPVSKLEKEMNTNIDELMKEFIKLMISISESSSRNSRAETIKAKQLSNKIIKYVNNQQASIREQLYKNIPTSNKEVQNKIFKIVQLAQIIINSCKQTMQKCNSQNFHIFVAVLKQIHPCMLLFMKNYHDLSLLPCFNKEIFSLWNQCLLGIISDLYFWMMQKQDEGQQFYCMCFYLCLLIGKMALQTNNYAHTYQVKIEYPLDPIPQFLQLVINKLPSMSTLKSRQKQRASSQISEQKTLILDFFIQYIELQVTRYCTKQDHIKDTEYQCSDSGQDIKAIMNLCHIYVNFVPGSIFSLYLVNLFQIVPCQVDLLIYLDDLIWSTANFKDVLLINEDQFHYLTIILCKYSVRIPQKQCNLQKNTRKWLSILWHKIVTNPHQSIKLIESTKTYMCYACSSQILQILFQQYQADSKLDSTYHSIYDNKYIKNIISYILSVENSQEFIYSTIGSIKQFITILFNVLIYPHDSPYEQEELFVVDSMQGSSSQLVLRYVSSLYLFITDQLNRTNFSYKNTVKLTYRKYLSISLLEQFHSQLNKISKKNSILQLYKKSLLQISNNIDSIECQNARDELLAYAVKLTIISHRQKLQIEQQYKESMQQENKNENIVNSRIVNKVSIFPNILNKKIQNLQIIQQCCQYLIQWCIKTNRIQVENEQMQALLQFIYVSLTEYAYKQNQKLDICYGYSLATYIFITVYTMNNPPTLKPTLLSRIACNQIRYLSEIIQGITYPKEIGYENKDNIIQFYIYILHNQDMLNSDITVSSKQQYINKILNIGEQVYNKLLQAITFYNFEQPITEKNIKTNRIYKMKDNVKKQKYEMNVKILYTELEYMSIEVDMMMIVMFCYYLLEIVLHIVQYIKYINRQEDKVTYGRLITMIYVIKKVLCSRIIINNKTNNMQVKQFLHFSIVVKILYHLNQVILLNIQTKLSSSNFLNIISSHEPNFYQKIKNLQQVRELFSQAENAFRQYSLQYGINVIQTQERELNQSKAGRIYKLIKFKDTT